MMDKISNSLSEIDQINKIKHITYCSKKAIIQMSAIDTLGAYGKPAIDAIDELINYSSIGKEVNIYALSVSQSIKNNS